MKIAFAYKQSSSYILKNWYLEDLFNALEYQVIIGDIEDEQLRKLRDGGD